MLHLAGKASIRRRPVNSALGLALNLAVAFHALRDTPQSDASSKLGKSSGRVQIAAVARLGYAPTLALRGIFLCLSHRRRESSSSVAPPPEGLVRLAIAVQAALIGHRRGSSTARAPGSADSEAPQQPVTPSACLRTSARPNWSFNRSANGRPPCPRGASCLCCTARARRPPVVARLTLR